VNPEQNQQLEDIKEAVAEAAQAMRRNDTVQCCNLLIDALVVLSEFLETLDDS
jgi:ketosteroid isomerase-like protein